MSRVFEASIDKLSKETGYSWDFLVDRYYECLNNGWSEELFVEVTKAKKVAS